MLSQTFKIQYLKIKDEKINKNSDEYEKIIDSLCKISNLSS